MRGDRKGKTPVILPRWFGILLAGVIGGQPLAMSVERREHGPNRWITVQTDKSVPLPISRPEKPSWSQRQYNELTKTFPRHLIGGARGLWNVETLVPLTLAGGAAAALVFSGDLDRKFSDDLREQRPIGKTGEDLGSVLGSPEVLFGLTGATYLLGDSLRAPRVRKVGEVALESLSLAGVGTAILKGVTQRERPDGSNNLSFPSLHAAGSFSVAASLYEDYGIGVSLPAFLMAGFISFARMQEGKHFVSDTIFGAALGTLTGLAVGKLHRAPKERSIRIAPLSGRDEVGLQVSLPSRLFR